MHRFMEAYRQKVDLLKGESQECSSGDGGSIIKQMTSTDDNEVTSENILVKLDRCNAGHARAFSWERDIPHIRQTETWDCGLACVQMILEWSRQSSNLSDLHLCSGHEGNDSSNSTVNQRSIEKAWMQEFVATKSIWTIDLVILLQHIISSASEMFTNNSFDQLQSKNNEEICAFDGQQRTLKPLQSSPLSFLFCSTNFGVDESYNNLGYYKDAFSSDELRVKNLFDIAMEQNLPLLQTSHLSLELMVDVVSREGVVAIVLLDNRILRHNEVSIESYSGHYVVLCGVSSDKNDINYAQVNAPGENDARPKFCMVVKNPGNWKQVEFVTPSLFEKAWRAKGTDEDVIFLSKNAI